MTTINNLTIEQMREIVSGAPEWATTYCMAYAAYGATFHWYGACKNCYELPDLRTTIESMTQTTSQTSAIILVRVRWSRIWRQNVMDEFEQAIFEHIPLFREGVRDKYYEGAEWAWQYRQAEVDQLKGLLEKDEYAHSLYYENANLQTLVEEKDKRIEELQAKVDAVEHVLGCAMIAPKEVFQYADRIGRALRGEHG